MAIKRFSRRNIYGLEEVLSSKISIAAIRSTLDDVLNTNSKDTVVSTSAFVEFKNTLKKDVEKAKKVATGIIDDTNESGTDKTWSIDKIKQFIASVDDSVVVQTIQDRDNLKAHNGLMAYVMDTSADNSLDKNFKGKPFVYIYSNGKWEPISPLAKEVDTNLFVKSDEVVNSTDSVDTKKPLSAAMGNKIVHEVIPAAVRQAQQMIVVDRGVIKNNKITVSKNIQGNIVGEMIEIPTDAGVVVVDAVVSGPKEITVLPGKDEDYEGKIGVVTYLANLEDTTFKGGQKTTNTIPDDGEGDGEVMTDDGKANTKKVNADKGQTQTEANKDQKADTKKVDADKDHAQTEANKDQKADTKKVNADKDHAQANTEKTEKVDADKGQTQTETHKADADKAGKEDANKGQKTEKVDADKAEAHKGDANKGQTQTEAHKGDADKAQTEKPASTSTTTSATK